jgi:hypothetical protein
MKKRFSMGWLLMVLWVLSACNTSLSPDEFVEPTEMLTFQIITADSLELSTPIEDDLNAFELLKVALEAADIHLLYQESEFGIFIEEIDAIKPPAGAYVMIAQNDEPLSVGLADAVFEPGDVFSFQLEFWDVDAGLRYQAIEDFLISEAAIFIDAASYEVFTALALLDRLEDTPPQALPMNENETIRSILISRSLNQDVTILQDQLATLYTTEFIFRASLGLIALEGSTHYEAALTMYNQRIALVDPLTTGFDDLAMIIIALDEATPLSIVEGFKSRLFENLNAPSLAHAIMALLVLEENPYEYFDENRIHLVDYLLSLQDESGGFKYDASSSASETRQFSSPQSFLALVTLNRYMNDQPVHPYRP